MNCNNKTAKNKDSSIPDISNGQGTVHWSLLKQQDLDTVITIKVPLLYPLLTYGTPFTYLV